MLERMKTGKCPFTGKPYDCSRCEVYKTLEFPKSAPYSLHFNLDFDDAIKDGRRGINFLRRATGYLYPYKAVKEYFTALAERGATCHPIGECDRFCFRRGCMGHVKSGESEQHTSVVGGVPKKCEHSKGACSDCGMKDKCRLDEKEGGAA